MADITGLFGDDGFDANSVEPMSDFGPLPPGTYQAEILATEIKRTKAGTGSYMSAKMRVVSGEYDGRILWDNINLSNPSEKCEEMGHAAFAAMALSAGLGNMKDTDELIGKVVFAVVKVKDGMNNIRTYNDGKGADVSAKAMDAPKPAPQPVTQAVSPVPTVLPQSGANELPPWAK